MTEDIAQLVVAARRVGFSLATRTVMRIADFHGVDAGEVFQRAAAIEPNPPRFLRRGRRPGAPLRCSCCGKAGHYRPTCPDRKRGFRQ